MAVSYTHLDVYKRQGMDMGIVNAGALPLYDDLEAELRERVEDVVLNLSLIHI